MPTIDLGIEFTKATAQIFCVKCKKRGYEKHHITYKPEKLALLCTKCHEAITKINTLKSRSYKKKLGYYKKLSNRMRWKLWRKFLDE